MRPLLSSGMRGSGGERRKAAGARGILSLLLLSLVILYVFKARVPLWHRIAHDSCLVV